MDSTDPENILSPSVKHLFSFILILPNANTPNKSFYFKQKIVSQLVYATFEKKNS